jgi:hypothetical protein
MGKFGQGCQPAHLRPRDLAQTPARFTATMRFQSQGPEPTARPRHVKIPTHGEAQGGSVECHPG